MRRIVTQPPHILTIETLAQACREESQGPCQHEQGYCFELFCRAFDQGDNAAWEIIQELYQRLMHHWLQTAVSDPLPANEAGELVQAALCRFWRLLKQHPEPVRQRFPHAGALLCYLRRCVQTAAIDHQRQRQKRQLLQERLCKFATQDVVNQIEAWEPIDEKQLQLQAIGQYIAQKVHDPHEKQLLYLSYTLGLKAREIVAHYPQQFASVKEVKRVKERVLKRMRRAFRN